MTSVPFGVNAVLSRAKDGFPPMSAHTAVTSAPKALASCTANVPTPPDAPVISTCCPGWTCPRSHTGCRAVKPETPTAAACSKARLAGLRASAFSGARAYSAYAPVPMPMPYTSSLGENLVTALPTASTTPARLMPATGFLGARSP